MGQTFRRVVSALVALAASAAMTTTSAAAASPPGSPDRAGGAAASEKLPLAPTPPLGWNSWNTFGCDIDAQLIEDTADAMVASGMRDAGYEYVNIDDCWMAPERDADGNLVPDPVRFPDGIAAVADYVHALDLKLGIYSSAGTATCQDLPASLGHEVEDARKFAEWGVDLLKYDNCHNEGLPAAERYQAMADALLASGRPILLSICEWGANDPWSSFGPELGQMWRTTGDITDTWGSVMGILDQQVGLEAYSGPNAWNDPDMLEVGNPGLTEDESRAHMSLWSLLNAPLIAGNDLRDMPDSTLAMLTNPDVLAVNQDWGGIQGHKIADDGDQEVWVKPMSDGGAAVVLLNRGRGGAAMETTAADLGLSGADAYRVTDVWSHAVTQTRGAVRASVPSHGARMFVVEPGRPAEDHPAITAAVDAGGFAAPGSDVTATVTVTNDGFTPVRDLTLQVTAPDGWTVRADEAKPVVVPPGDAVTRKVVVSVPVQATTGTYELGVEADYTTVDKESQHVSGTGSVAVATAPRGERYVSDLEPVSAQVGWGDLGVDESTDGNPITLGGTRYEKGVAAHAASEVEYYLGGVCSAFTADVGIDDEVGDRGTVTFTVLGDGKVLDETGVVTGADDAITVDADLAGVELLTLRAGVGPEGSDNYDHAEWADARVSCAGPVASVGVDPQGTVEVGAGSTVDVTGTLTVSEGTATDVRLAPYAPSGWTVEGEPATADRLAAGESLAATWSVAVPADAEPGVVEIPLVATFTGEDSAGLVVERGTARVSVLPDGGLLTREAEAAQNTPGGAARVVACGACSGGQKVGYVGSGAANDLTLPGIEVAEAGEYGLVVDYLVSGTRTVDVSVNGGPAQTLTLTGGSFSTPASTTARVRLDAGENVVRFFNDAAYAPDLDRIAVTR